MDLQIIMVKLTRNYCSHNGRTFREELLFLCKTSGIKSSIKNRKNIWFSHQFTHIYLHAECLNSCHGQPLISCDDSLSISQRKLIIPLKKPLHIPLISCITWWGASFICISLLLVNTSIVEAIIELIYHRINCFPDNSVHLTKKS